MNGKTMTGFAGINNIQNKLNKLKDNLSINHGEIRSNSINLIKAPIQNELKEFQKRFKVVMQSSNPLLNNLLKYLKRTPGKQFRPILVLLSAKINGTINDSTYTAAILIELLHSATLIHDDVIDDSFKRRGLPSVKALWQNKTAVLLGDYLLSKSLFYSVEQNQFEFLKVISGAIKKVVKGEMMQMEKIRKIDTSEKRYMEIIRRKTAIIIAASCEIGALSVDAPKQVVLRMAELGLNIGMAFQIRDDLFDYLNCGITGKPRGLDLKEKNITLPLIHVLKSSPFINRLRIIQMIKKLRIDSKKYQFILDYVNQKGGVEYAQNILERHCHKAQKILIDFKDSESKRSLEELVSYSIQRVR